MLLRIALIVALLAGLGVAAVSHFMVSEKITTITSERDDYQTRMTTAQEAEASAKKQVKKTTEDLRATNTRLATATNELAVQTTRANQQERRANDAASALETAARERNEALQELASWRALQITVDQVSNVIATVKRVTLERDVYADEKTVLLRQNSKLQAKLDYYEDPIKPIVMREGLKGKVVAIDPKWDFIVLDIGAEQGALEKGEMFVNRDGKLVAKVRIASVQQNRSIANILPDWRLGEIMEGDQVSYLP